MCNGKKEFLVRWKNHKPDQDSWEPEENIISGKPHLKTKVIRKQKKNS